MLKKSLVMFLLLFNTLLAAQEGMLEIITLNNRPAEEVQPLLAPLLEPSERVVADGTNLIIRATPQRLQEIKGLVAQLDAKLHNFLITVLQAQNISAAELNANANVSVTVPINKPSATSANIQGALNAAQSRNVTDNTQTLRTLEGQTAYIKAGSAQPVQTVTIYNSGSGYPAVANSTAMLEATTGFAVTPRLSGDGVMLAVSPWSDRIQNDGTFTTQSATTNLRVKLGEWIEIGGVNDANQYRREGLLSANRGNRSSSLHILVKVEIID